MDSLLKEIVGKNVTVYTGQGYSDNGMLDAFDEHFIRIRDEKGRHRYFPIVQVRLIKPD